MIDVIVALDHINARPISVSDGTALHIHVAFNLRPLVGRVVKVNRLRQAGIGLGEGIGLGIALGAVGGGHGDGGRCAEIQAGADGDDLAAGEALGCAAVDGVGAGGGFAVAQGDVEGVGLIDAARGSRGNGGTGGLRLVDDRDTRSADLTADVGAGYGEVVAGDLVGVIAGGNQAAAVGNGDSHVGAACRNDDSAAVGGLVAAADDVAVVLTYHVLAEADHGIVEVVDRRNFLGGEVRAALLTGHDRFLVGEGRSGQIEGLGFCLGADYRVSAVDLVLVDVLCPAAVVGKGVVALCPVDDFLGSDALVDPVAAVADVHLSVSDGAHDGAAVDAVGDADVVSVFLHDIGAVAAGRIKDLTVAIQADLGHF